MRNRNGRRSAAVVAALALLAFTTGVSGCGGSDEPDALKRSEFVAQANAICVNAQDERKQGTEDLADDDGADQVSVVTEALIEPVAEMTEELSELGPPKGEAQQVGEMIGAFEAGVAELEADPVSAGSASAFTKASKLAAEYGLPKCAI